MRFMDKSLRCINCGNTFTFTIEKQFSLWSKGDVHEPKHCPSCGQGQMSLSTIGYRGRHKMYSAICARCGKDAKVPFKTSNDMHVYCSDCYSWVAQSRY